jgi:hypothetical protein
MNAILMGRVTLVALLVCGLPGCSVHPGPDVSQIMQSEVAPGPDEAAVPAAPAVAAPAHLSPLLAPVSVSAAGTAQAGATSLTVTAGPSLSGAWKFYLPHRMGISLTGVVSYSRVTMHLCRLVQRGGAISGDCLLHEVTPVAGSVQGDRFRLRLPGLTFEGRVIGWNRLQGGLTVQVLGLGVTPALPAAAERRVGAAARLPAAGTEAAVRAAIGDALAGRRQPALGGLGALESVSYVDAQDVLGPTGDKLASLAVFAADFAQGTRLCGVALGQDGQIDRFMCG